MIFISIFHQFIIIRTGIINIAGLESGWCQTDWAGLCVYVYQTLRLMTHALLLKLQGEFGVWVKSMTTSLSHRLMPLNEASLIARAKSSKPARTLYMHTRMVVIYCMFDAYACFYVSYFIGFFLCCGNTLHNIAAFITEKKLQLRGGGIMGVFGGVTEMAKICWLFIKI